MARTDDALQEAKDNLETLITDIEDGDFSLVMYNTAIAQAAALISIAESLAKLVELQERNEVTGGDIDQSVKLWTIKDGK